MVVNCSSGDPKCEEETGTYSCKHRSGKKLRGNKQINKHGGYSDTHSYGTVYWIYPGIITAYMILAARLGKK